jgi:hypothetical protein
LPAKCPGKDKQSRLVGPFIGYYEKEFHDPPWMQYFEKEFEWMT